MTIATELMAEDTNRSKSKSKSESKTIDAKEARAQVRGMRVTLVTGGSGYIGCHTVLELLIAGQSVVVLDDMSNSRAEALTRVCHLARIAGIASPKLHFVRCDVRDRRTLDRIMACYNTEDTTCDLHIVDVGGQTQDQDQHQNQSSQSKSTNDKRFENGKISHVVHFAALKAVGESVSRPLDYYSVNVFGLLTLLAAMDRFHVHNIVFSSSAVVYGSGNGDYIDEDAVHVGGEGRGVGLLTNPYGRSKWMCEEILNDWCTANPEARVVALRYFNPTGCHPSGLIGEDPKGIPNNLMPIVLQTYQRRRSHVSVFGSDYDTTDGSGVRDYIHVVDLARGHVAALNRWIRPIEPTDDPSEESNYQVYNLGTGTGYSVLEIIKAFEQATRSDIPFEQGGRRRGDLACVTANPTRAFRDLGWRATFGLSEMCKDLATWADLNPDGYARLKQLSNKAADDTDGFLQGVQSAEAYRSQEKSRVRAVRQSLSGQGGLGIVSTKLVAATREVVGEEDADDKRVAGLLADRDLTGLIKLMVTDDALFEHCLSVPGTPMSQRSDFDPFVTSPFNSSYVSSPGFNFGSSEFGTSPRFGTSPSNHAPINRSNLSNTLNFHKQHVKQGGQSGLYTNGAQRSPMTAMSPLAWSPHLSAFSPPLLSHFGETPTSSSLSPFGPSEPRSITRSMRT